MKKNRPVAQPWKPCFFIIGLLILLYPTAVTAADSVYEQVNQRLANRLAELTERKQLKIGNESILALNDFIRFYQRNQIKAVWMDNDGPLPIAAELIQSLKSSSREGLVPSAYHLPEIESLFGILTDKRPFIRHYTPNRMVELEMLLTDGFLVYGSHLLAGHVKPETIDTEWITDRSSTDLSIILQQAISTRQIAETLTLLAPSQVGYFRLKKALHQYQLLERQGGWPAIQADKGISLKRGDRNPLVPVLRQRLYLTNDLSSDPGIGKDDLIFDAKLVKAVSHFQSRHGIQTHGRLDKTTLKELNVPIQERITQLIVNLERWRWLPRDFGNPHILVNIPGYELELIDQSKSVLKSKVIVGKAYRHTPVFSGTMEYLVFNPLWYIPITIATEDILPQVKKDLGYLAKNGIDVFNSSEKDPQQLDPATIDWAGITKDNFTYLFRQQPGPDNGLGVVKFIFPNEFGIYLHDTPHRELFRETTREFSSGCIRVEKSIELALYLLQDNPGWNRDKIDKTVASGAGIKVDLARPVAVHLLYWTAWVDAGNTIHFAKDIYQRDKILAKALSQVP